MRDGNPTQLGEAIAHYGRIFKTLDILAYAVEESYRRNIKGVRNPQESRHALAGKVFHGRKGEIYQRCYKGMEDQLGALGLVLNCVTLWNVFYMDKALRQLRADGYPLLDEDVAPPVALRGQAHQRDRHLLLRRPRPGPWRRPRTARPRHRRRR